MHKIASTLGVVTVGFLLLITNGCGAVGPHIEMVSANYSYGRGDLQNALVAYLGLIDRGVYPSEIAYNLGGVYHSFGEMADAEKEWEQALGSDQLETRASALHNLGVLAYEQGLFSKAYEHFKASLRLVPESQDTKVNLELSYLKLQGEVLAGTDEQEPQNQVDQNLSRESERVLRYVQRKESELWYPGQVPQTEEEVAW